MSDDRPDWLRTADTDPSTVVGVYDDWVDSYEDDVEVWDYRAPQRIVEMLVRLAPGVSPVLDVGCGVGLVGRELVSSGFETIVGIDLSPRSLEVAAAAGVYESLHEADLQSQPIPFDDDAFAALVCVGVMTYLPDTAGIVGELCRVVRSGGPILYTQREDVWLERDDPATLDRLVTQGVCTVEEISEPGRYLPNSEELGDVPARFVALRPE